MSVSKGEAYSYTEFWGDQVPSWVPWNQRPLVIGLIHILEGELAGHLVTAQITQLDMEWDEEQERWIFPELRIGLPVEGVLGLLRTDAVVHDPDRGLRAYGEKFRPVLPRADE